jgi:hypothetical protein
MEKMEASMKKFGLFGIILVGGVVLGILGSILGYWLIVPRMAFLPGGGRCIDCHQMHGAIEIDDLTTDGLIWLAGDVEEPVWIEVYGMFQTHREDGLAEMTLGGENGIEDHHVHPGIRLRDLISEYGGVEDFERVVLISADGGHVSIEEESVSKTARLEPWLNSARFADEKIHSSAWFRGITKIIVVGTGPNLVIDGEPTSLGALLAPGDLRTVAAEPGPAMLADRESGEIYRNVTSHLFTGADVLRICGCGFEGVEVTAGGEQHTLPAEKVNGAILAHGEDTPTPTLIMPELSRGEWLFDVTALDCLP